LFVLIPFITQSNNWRASIYRFQVISDVFRYCSWYKFIQVPYHALCVQICTYHVCAVALSHYPDIANVCQWHMRFSQPVGEAINDLVCEEWRCFPFAFQLQLGMAIFQCFSSVHRPGPSGNITVPYTIVYPNP
jgi:hypothetical protein